MSETPVQNETPETQAVKPSNDTHHSPDTRHSLVHDLKSKVARAVLFVAPVLSACGPQDDADAVSSAALTRDTSSETAENAGYKSRQVKLWTDGTAWEFEGKYPADRFHLTVMLDGSPRFDAPVQLADGSFHVSGTVGDASDIDIQAFQILEDGQKGPEIVIEPDPNTQGMYGNPHCDAGLY